MQMVPKILHQYDNITILPYYHIPYNIIGHCIYMSKKSTVETYYMVLLYFSLYGNNHKERILGPYIFSF